MSITWQTCTTSMWGLSLEKEPSELFVKGNMKDIRENCQVWWGGRGALGVRAGAGPKRPWECLAAAPDPGLAAVG